MQEIKYGIRQTAVTALQAALGNRSDAKKTYQDSTCDIAVNGRLAGLAASMSLALPNQSRKKP